ncbi:DUF6498-containing protein [Nitriliruptor alkaliphilus]|uniref:DUF6498-containing protein n=1 Tax=Nitriliruptor alkaliphilus TaxID=427918 RepID=UPI0006984AE0|nr:DUF6498-containing protein [Nitriliruptor alkaliphilus]
MGWLLEARGRASVGQWLGTALLAIGVLTGQLRAPQLLYAAWLENISVGIAATVSLARSNRGSVAVPPWMAAQIKQGRGGLVRSVGPNPPPAPPPWSSSPPPSSQPHPPSSQPPPPPPGARPSAPGPAPGLGPGAPVPPGHVSLAVALLILLVPLAMMTSFQGRFISVLGHIGSFGADGGGVSPAGGVVATALLVLAAAARAFRRIAPDQALGYAFGHVVTLHLGMMIGFFAIVAAVFGSAVTGSAGPMELAATAALVGWFAVTDRLKVGNRPPG